MTFIESQQRRALAAPLIGRSGDHPLIWPSPPFSYGLSFNR